MGRLPAVVLGPGGLPAPAHPLTPPQGDQTFALRAGGRDFRKWAPKCKTPFCLCLPGADGWTILFDNPPPPHLCMFKMISASWGSF